MFIDLKGKVYLADLATKAGASKNAGVMWAKNNDKKVDKIGSLSFIDIKELPRPGRGRMITTEFIDDCLDLDGYYPKSAFETLMNVSPAYLDSMLKRYKKQGREERFPFEYVRVGRIVFVKMPDDIVEILRSGKNVHIIHAYTKIEDLAEYESKGFYNGVLYGWY